jgi:hypothetical protein
MGRWWVAAGLLLLGLLLSGFNCPGNLRDHLPARAEARAASAHQSLRRQSDQSDVKVEEAKAAPPALALLLSLMAPRPHVSREPVVAEAATGESSLWLVPYLFRPPPADILVR